ncbi:MAG: type I restriction-modification system subunit M [Candidatus Ancillula sp.]|jgi:type I restriction enzyme M protein|nr:type I restriction-modification system subunit M [Candidatus Ancillula sp.]
MSNANDMTTGQKSQLHTSLWNIANELRGHMDADDFRDYILAFIFYKYLSEKVSKLANELLEPDGLEFAQIVNQQKYVNAIRFRAVEELGYFLEPSELFEEVAAKAESNPNLNTDLDAIFDHIQKSTLGTESEDDFENLFSEIDLASSKLGRTLNDRNKLIAKVLRILAQIDFQLENSQIDILGDAYEYMIGQFASGAGKKAGEFYTPQEVSEILARIVKGNKQKIDSVYDPTCGSGSLLIRVGLQFKDSKNIEYYGQESNPTTYNLARMNMILHDINYKRFDIALDDTLVNPQHTSKKFEAVVANPPFSAKWSADPMFLDDERFAAAGKLAPKSKADWAFLEHMIFQLDENGTMASIVPHGVLFRGAAEQVIRTYYIREKNYLDAVIGLPSNVFFGTSIPVAIVVFKKHREHPENVLFIDASREFQKGKNQNKLREEDIKKIIDTYNDRIELDKYSHLAPLSQIEENDYNLNISRYVDTFEEEEPVDIAAVLRELDELNPEIELLEAQMREHLEKLGIVRLQKGAKV